MGVSSESWDKAISRTNMDTFQVIFHVLLLFSQPLSVGACVSKYSNRPLYGYRCTDSSNTGVTVSQTDRPQCVWKCLKSEMCHYLNHHHDTRQCVLGLGRCDTLTPAIGFTINAFGPPRDSCLRWGSRQEPSRSLVEIPGLSCLVRITAGNILLIGKFDMAPWETFWANNEGVRLGPLSEIDLGIEFLTVDPACPVLWTSFTVGESLQFGVIGGGHLSDGSITYVSKVIVNGYTGFAYCNARSELAYYECAGA